VNDSFEMLRAANPVPECPPPPIDELWAGLDLETELADLEVERRWRHRKPTFGGLATTLAAAIAVAVAVVALTVLKHHAPAKLSLGRPIGATDLSGGNLEGRVIPGSVKLVAFTPDTSAGLQWGLRAFETTSGQLCMQLGRLQSGTFGMLGRDGAFANDGRFHPFATGAFGNAQCSRPRAAGHNFALVASREVVASAGVGLVSGGCRTGPAPRAQVACPHADLRYLYYGLVGPSAWEVDYQSPDGRHTSGINAPQVGPGVGDGAYLVVFAVTPERCVRQMWPGGSGQTCTGGIGTLSQAVLRSGARPFLLYPGHNHICYLPPTSGGLAQGRCPRFGYGAPPYRAAPVTEAQVKTKVTVHVRRAQNGQVPVDISFTARISAADGSYQAQLGRPVGPGCSDGGSAQAAAGAGTGQAALGKFTAGQRVVFQFTVNACRGRYTGSASYQPTGRPPVPVGQFSFVIR
jgi:hypothetical protein